MIERFRESHLIEAVLLTDSETVDRLDCHSLPILPLFVPSHHMMGEIQRAMDCDNNACVSQVLSTIVVIFLFWLPNLMPDEVPSTVKMTMSQFMT